MISKKINVLTALIIATLTLHATELPVSREAVLVEVVSPTEVMVKATGIGIDPKGKKKPKAEVLAAQADKDALKAAVWFVMLGGTDPLISTDAEKSAFMKIQEPFFKVDNLRKFISWEAQYYEKRIKIEGGKKLKVEKNYKINTELLRQELVAKNILKKSEVLAAAIGMPSIMVIPDKKDGIAPLELLKTDANLKKGAEVIESYLTAKKFEVIVPEQQQVLQELTSTQYAMDGAEDDYSYLLALSIGSDVYISYNVKIEQRKIGSSVVKKGIVGCRAYETTTGRLLGTETGYSKERPAADAALIEEAMNDAIDKVISRILNYWKKDFEAGVQYKVMLSVSDFFETEEAEDIMFDFSDLVKEMSKDIKENTMADYTYDIQIWVNPKDYESVTDIYRYLRSNYNGDGRLKRVSLSRKLILLSIEEE